MTIVRPTAAGVFPRVPLPFYGDVALGNVTQYKIAISAGGNGLVVGIETHGTYSFGSFVHWIYASEKLQLMQSDAENVSDFINDQLGVNPELRQGRYELGLTSDG